MILTAVRTTYAPTEVTYQMSIGNHKDLFISKKIFDRLMQMYYVTERTRRLPMEEGYRVTTFGFQIESENLKIIKTEYSHFSRRVADLRKNGFTVTEIKDKLMSADF